MQLDGECGLLWRAVLQGCVCGLSTQSTDAVEMWRHRTPGGGWNSACVGMSGTRMVVMMSHAGHACRSAAG